MRTSWTSPEKPASLAWRPIPSTGAFRTSCSAVCRTSPTSIRPSASTGVSRPPIRGRAHSADTRYGSGGDYRWDTSSNRTDTNARGGFVFTTSGGLELPRGSGFDFTDFLYGLPQQATVQYGPGNVELRGRSMSLFLQDDWRKSNTLTFNLGLRCDLQWPFTEASGQMVPRCCARLYGSGAGYFRGQRGPYTGSFPESLLDADTNNIGPRVGVAWRLIPGTILRGGYGISFNAGAYSTIARQLVGQPPFAVTNTATGTRLQALSLNEPLATSSPDETTNNYGVQRDYALGVVQTWNADLSRDLRQVWSVGAGYTDTRGTSLDILRAPNRGPEGLRIQGVQPFVWQSSDGSSVLHAATFRVRRRPVRGLGGGLSCTLARSRDNASSIGGGASVVAQDDRNLSAGMGPFELRPAPPSDWRYQHRTPFRRKQAVAERRGRVGASARELANQRSVHLPVWDAADAAGDGFRKRRRSRNQRHFARRLRRQRDQHQRSDHRPVFQHRRLQRARRQHFWHSEPQHDHRPRQPSAHAQLSRDVRMGRTRALTLQMNATNLLNTVNYQGIDTVVNSPTFGQVMSVRPMRSMTVNLRFRF